MGTSSWRTKYSIKCGSLRKVKLTLKDNAWQNIWQQLCLLSLEPSLSLSATSNKISNVPSSSVWEVLQSHSYWSYLHGPFNRHPVKWLPVGGKESQSQGIVVDGQVVG